MQNKPQMGDKLCKFFLFPFMSNSFSLIPYFL